MPKSKLVAVLLFAGVVVLVLWLNGRSADTAKDPADRPARLTVTSSPTVTPPVTITETPTAPDPDPVAERHAVDAVTAWQDQNPTTRQEHLAPLVIPELLDLYSYTDPTSVPTSPVQTATTREFGEGSSVVDVTLQDGTRLVVTIDDIAGNGTALVTGINPA